MSNQDTAINTLTREQLRSLATDIEATLDRMAGEEVRFTLAVLPLTGDKNIACIGNITDELQLKAMKSIVSSMEERAN